MEFHKEPRGESMVDTELQKEIACLVDAGKLETAERLLVDYVEQNPYDIEGWNRLIILETLAPIEDYEQASDYARSAMHYHPYNPLYFILILSFTPWYKGELDEELVEVAKAVKDKMDAEFAAVISLQLAGHYETKDVLQYESLLKQSIDDNPNLVKNFTELGQYYLAYGQKELGKALIREGLSRVQLVYKDEENDDEDIDWLDIERYVNEMITGVFMTESSYRELEELLQR